MHVEFLVEEPSAEAALRVLVPMIVGSNVSFDVHPFQGKLDLLGKLPKRLNGYHHWLANDDSVSVVVLVDLDAADCHGRPLKADLENMAHRAGLTTRSTARAAERIQVINRLAIEELEAWFFGDPKALVAAYPKVSLNFARQSRHRDPDAIMGGTWEALERVLQRAGYYKTGLAKIEVAGLVAQYMEPDRNRSKSFQVFRDSLRMIAANV